MLTTQNAGGTSENSEALSYELMHRLVGVELVKTEMQIRYKHDSSKKTDYLVEFQNKKIAVSVTRAMKYPNPAFFTPHDAEVLLKKKLFGVHESNAGVSAGDHWSFQILHIWTQTDRIAEILANTYEELERDLRGDTIVITTVANEPWLY